MLIRAPFACLGVLLGVGVGCSTPDPILPTTAQGGSAGADAVTGGSGTQTSPSTGGSSGSAATGQGGAGGQDGTGTVDASGPDPVDDGGAGSSVVADAAPTPPVDAGPSSLTGKKGLWDLPGLLRIRAQASSGPLKPAYDAAVALGDAALTAGPFSVMDKTTVPPSGDKHDYVGLARYFWPDPSKPSGLPYISKDGQSNPDVDTNKYDYHAMLTMSGAVSNLGLAYFLTRNEKYAQKAHDLLKVWYIDAATKMNPNLNYAQSVPGVATGRKDGVIDTLQMTFMIDGIEMLRDSPAFAPADFDALKTWFTSFLDWLRTSAFGKAEEASTNNHGSWYDVQTMRYAIFLDNKALAMQLAESAKTRRIASQINPDGSEPLEIARTNSLYYSEYDLTADFGIAQLAADVGVDLFGYQTADGRSIRKALDFLVPYADPAKTWPYPQILVDDRSLLIPLLRRASIAYNTPAYEQTLEKYYAAALPAHITQLVYPQ